VSPDNISPLVNNFFIWEIFIWDIFAWNKVFLFNCLTNCLFLYEIKILNLKSIGKFNVLSKDNEFNFFLQVLGNDYKQIIL
jgi:hypothetical protein